MKFKKVNMSVFVLFALFFSIFLTTSMGFSQTVHSKRDKLGHRCPVGRAYWGGVNGPLP